MGLLDWLTDGPLGNMGMGAGGANPPAPSMPPVQQTGADGPPLPPTPAAVPPGFDAAPTPSGQPPDPTPAAGPPDPPVNPATSDIGGGMQGGGPTPPPVPMPQPRPPGADAAPPAPPTPGPPMPLTPSSLPPPGNGTNGVGPGLGVGAPPPGFATAPSAPGGPYAPDAGTGYHLGDQTALGRALGINPKSKTFNDTLGGIGAGLTAAGNSKGKSPFQALTSGAGASIEGANKESHASEKDANAYLAQAIASKKAGDDAAYKTNYTSYLAAKLKSEQDAAASKDKAVANKNDSPTQLYLSAQRNVAADPLVKGAMTAYQAAIKDGDPTKVATAKSAYEQTVQERQAAHLAGVGLHPQTAADIAKQPGMSQANPINGKTSGITPENIGSKLQVGQYYTNPSNGQLFVYKGEPTESTSTKSSPSSEAEPANPMKKDKVAANATADEDDD